MKRRKYEMTLADLIDRLSIIQLKAIFIPEHSKEYAAEQKLVEHDIDMILKASKRRLGAAEVHAILVIMLTNRFIWENESKARVGGPEQDRLLKLTHSINGVRAAAKNRLSGLFGGRMDYKVDALAADLPAEFGNWRIFK